MTVVVPHRVLAAACATTLLLAPQRALAASPGSATARTQLTAHADLVVRHNPLGVMAIAGALWRRVLAEDSVFGPTRYLQLGAILGANPAYAQGGAYIEWMPAVFSIVRVQYDRFAYLGAYGGLLSFSSAGSRYGDEELAAREGSEEAAAANRMMLQLTLRAKIGRLILRNQTDIAGYRFGGTGPYLLDLENDLLLARDDVLIANRIAAPVQLWGGGPDAILAAGPYYEVVHAASSGLTRQRLGAVFFMVPATDWHGCRRPRGFAQLGINMADRNRAHQFFAVVGMGTDFDF